MISAAIVLSCLAMVIASGICGTGIHVADAPGAHVVIGGYGVLPGGVMFAASVVVSLFAIPADIAKPGS